MSNQSAWGAMHLPSNRTRRLRGYGVLEPSVLQPFPTAEDPFVTPEQGPLVTPEDQAFILGITNGFDEGDDGLDLPIGKTPGAVPVRVNNWDVDGEPFATYRIAQGDTLSGLAITYLGDGTRWPEIWKTGGNQAKFPDPNFLDSIGPLDMPEEARDRMKAFISKGQPTGTTPGQIKPSEVKKIKERPTRIAVGVIAVVALVATGVVVYNVAT